MSNTAQVGSSTQGSQSQTSSEQPQVDPRQAEEQARKDRTLTEFMLMLDNYEPMVRNFDSALQSSLTK